MTMSPVRRRYILRILFTTGLYIAFLSVALRLIERGGVTGVPAYLLAALPGLAIIGMFWAIGRLLIEMKDEYLRMLLVRQTLIATAFALSIASVWGFLELFDLVPHVPAFYLAVLWFAGLGVGQLYNRVTLGPGGGCA